MELIRYRPDPAIRWLQVNAVQIKKAASKKGKSVANQSGTDQRPFGENLKTAAGALVDYGKGAYAELKHKQANASEYVLQTDRLDIVSGGSIKTIPFAEIKAVQLDKDRATLILDKGSVAIRPFAHIASGKARVPIGWLRNGIDVPYELLIEEIAARAGVAVQIGP